MTQQEKRIYLIEYLPAERGTSVTTKLPHEEQEQRRLLRSLLNIRPPEPVSADFLRVQDEYLQQELRARGVTGLCDMQPVRPELYLWQGDITTLACDAIVNAANSGLLGCFYPCHGCIDNAIHTFSGVQLRLECARLMQAQGHGEETGRAKLTPAYNLPCKYVLHTVGPIVGGRLTKHDREMLADCYRSCLMLAGRCGVRSIAFPCISTGEFHFPNRPAAEIAIRTVSQYKARTGSRMKVIFNVFKNSDYEIYRELLG